MYQSIPQLFKYISETSPTSLAQLSKDKNNKFQPVTYKELYYQVCCLAAALQTLGVKKDDHVGLIADNRKEWLVSDLAVLSLGAADVPRGCDTFADEIAYILSLPECRVTFAENLDQAEKIVSVKDKIPLLETIILIEGTVSETLTASGLGITTYDYLLTMGENLLAETPDIIEKIIEKGKPDDLATIIFTSGTTGEPKGVMLTHNNFLYQLGCVSDMIDVKKDDIWLSVLPVWHSFERILQYITIFTTSTLAYSKPIGKIMLMDFQAVRPVWMGSVPRIWAALQNSINRNIEAKGGVSLALFRFFVIIGGCYQNARNKMMGRVPVFKRQFRFVQILSGIIPYVLLTPLNALGQILIFSKIKAKLGGKFRAGISGGGGLPEGVDKFFASAGILLLEGYGLTETAPVLSFRPISHPIPGTAGRILDGTEYSIRDEEGKILGHGEKGILWVRGPQLMKGYYKKPDLTKSIMDNEGWLNTGDLALSTVFDEIRIVGRAKDTIVLMGGENVEPVPIEQKILESPYIAQIIVVGQDQKYLSALIIPDYDTLEEWVKKNNISYENRVHLTDLLEVNKLISEEINALVSTKSGFRIFEKVWKFTILRKDFVTGRELSHKQELKRNVIAELYEKDIKGMY